MGQILYIAISVTVRHIVHVNTPLYLQQHTLYLECFIIYIVYLKEIFLENQLSE